jgi:hypothetical protein
VKPARVIRLAVSTVILTLCGCASLKTVTDPLLPSHDRPWITLLAKMPTAEFRGERVHIRGIRDFVYMTDTDFVPRYSEAIYSLDEIEGVDFIVAPFRDTPSLAHTMLSFRFNDGRVLTVSAEARLELGEKYHPLAGALHQYELMYVLGTERDLITLRTEHRDVDVYLYPVKTKSAQARQLLLSVLHRVNKLSEEPEFYDTLTNNCTTNIVSHVNELSPGRVPLNWRYLLPGYSDQLAYDLGLIDTSLPFTAAREMALVNDRVDPKLSSRDFSTALRR